jgi:hypothetical protein
MQKAPISLLLGLGVWALSGCSSDDTSTTPAAQGGEAGQASGGSAGSGGDSQGGAGVAQGGAGQGGAGQGGTAGAAGSGAAGEAGAGGSGAVGYATDVQPILAKHCSTCHTTDKSGGANFATSYDDTQLDSYHCAGKTKGACTIERIKDGSMPKGKGCSGDPTKDAGNAACLTAAEQATIQAWVDSGEAP